jgi:hypothetical protein
VTKRWANAARVNLDPRSFEQRLWDDYSLALIFPRFVPSFVEDDVIDEYLYRLNETERLPWSLS